MNNKLRHIYLILLLVTSTVTGFAATITSVQSGPYNNSSTWDCGCTPGTGDDIVIATGHSVELAGNTTLNNLTVDLGGTFSDNNKTLKINGNLVLNGSLINRKNATLQAATGNISGSGIKDNRGKLVFAGNYTVLAGSDLSFVKGNVEINNGKTVTNNGTVTIVKDLNGKNGASTWTNAANSTLVVKKSVMVTGTLNAHASGNTVMYVNNRVEDIKNPSSSYYNLTINGSDITWFDGDLIVQNDFSILSGDCDMWTKNLTVGGNFTQNGVMTVNTQNITFNGTGDQTFTAMTAFTMYDLIINKPSGEMILASNLSVENELTMTQGDINSNGNTLTLGLNTSTIGTLTHTAGNILGKFEKWYSATGTYDTPLGVSGTSRNLRLGISTLTTSGSMVYEFVASDPGNSGFDLFDSPDSLFNQFNEGYWTMSTSNGLDIGTYTVELTGDGMVTFPIVGATRVIQRGTAGSAWQLEGTHVVAVGNIAKRSGLTSLPTQFGFADTTNCLSPITSAVTGTASVCTDDTGIAYSVTDTPGSTYAWTITGGTQASGGTTNAITVDWGSTGGTGIVQCIENNGCSNGAPVTTNVTIEALPTGTISGTTNVPENSTQSYSVTARAGYTYTWTIVGGTIQSGQGTDNVSVLWGAAGAGSVCVDATCPCGSAAQVCQAITVYYMIESLATGNFNNTAIWDCACIPSNSDNIRIKSGHTVTLNGNYKTTNMEIESGATFFDNGRDFTVYGNLTVNGNYTGTKNLKLQGIDTYVNGTGTISNTGELRIEQGSKSVESNALLTKSPGDVNVKSGITLTNKGKLTVGGEIIGQDDFSRIVNDENATLIAGGDIFTTGTLVATSTGNTVTYNGSAAQDIIFTDFYNLTTNGVATTSLTADVNVAGTVTIKSGSGLQTNGNNINVTGDWTNEGGTFTEGSGTVTFNGTSTQTITSTAVEVFNNMASNSGATVNVASGTEITINGTLTNAGTLDNDGKINFTNGYESQSGTLSGDGTHEVKGNWNMTGTFSKDAGKVVFSGGSAQTIQGTSLFNDVEINNTNGVSVTGGTQELRGTLNLTTGNFATNDAFTLKSDGSGTGRIAEITGGSISGKLRAERYITSSGNKWRMLASPVNSTDFEDYDGEMATSGIPGSDDPGSWYKSFYWYDETVAGTSVNGWTPPTAMTDAVQVGVGYYTQFQSADAAIDVQGYTNTGLINIPLTYTPDQGPLDDGWNLIANPYPCEIDWDAATGWTKNNLNNAIYIWHPDLGVYATYVAGIGTNGGSRYIAQGQAFFVQTNAASPSLSCTEQVKVATNPTFFRSPQLETQMLKFIATKGSTNMKDELILNFGQANFTANKRYTHDDRVVEIAAVSNGADQVIANIDLSTQAEISIPVMLVTEADDECTLQLENLSALAELSCITLVDLVTGNEYNLHEVSEVTIDLEAHMTTPRFVIEISKAVDITSTDATCYASGNGTVAVVSAGEAHAVSLFNSSEELILSTTTTNFEANNLRPDTYHLIVETASCANAEMEVVIAEPTELQTAIAATKPTCKNLNNGAIDIKPNGGTAPYTYQWENGTTTPVLSQIGTGTYQVSIEDALGCKAIQNIQLAAIVSRDLTIDAEVNPTSNGSIVQLSSNFTDTDVMVWTFADDYQSFEETPIHEFTTDEVVDLYVMDDQCEYHTEITIRPTKPAETQTLPIVFINQDGENDAFEFNQRNEQIAIEAREELITPANFYVYDNIGNLVKEFRSANTTTTFETQGLAKGIYIMKVDHSSFKFFVQ